MGYVENVTITAMLKSGILNPALSSLLCRVRHTNTLIITAADFPHFPDVETVDLSLTDDIPRVSDVLDAIEQSFVIGRVEPATLADVATAIGIVRTGDSMPLGSIVIESA